MTLGGELISPEKGSRAPRAPGMLNEEAWCERKGRWVSAHDAGMHSCLAWRHEAQR